MRIVLMATLLLLSPLAAEAAATELRGELSWHGPTYAGRQYAFYDFEFDAGERASVALKPDDFSGALVVIAPDGRAHAAPVEPWATGVEVRVDLDAPAPGRWTAMVTSGAADATGAYVLAFEGVEGIGSLAAQAPESALTEKAFAALYVFTGEAWRRHVADLLAERLGLASYRRDLLALLRQGAPGLSDQIAADQEAFDLAEARRREVAAALAEVEAAPDPHPVIVELLHAERDQADLDVDAAAWALADTSGMAAAMDIAAERLDAVDRAAERLRRAELALVAAAPASPDVMSEFLAARAAFLELSQPLAQKLVESGLAETLGLALGWTLLGRTPVIEEAPDDLVFEAPEEPIIIAEPEPLGGFNSDAFDPTAFLSQLLPWPPPAASARALIDRRAVVSPEHPDPTLGDVSDALTEALAEAGYLGSGFLGAPGGFAIATRVEQFDMSGAPLDGLARWSTKIGKVESFALADIFRALFSAPKGYFRVIVLVVSDSPLSDSGGRASLATLQAWMHADNALPDAVRRMPFTDAHQVTALVYEFEKRSNVEEQALLHVPGLLDASRHFAHTSLASNLR